MYINHKTLCGNRKWEQLQPVTFPTAFGCVFFPDFCGDTEIQKTQLKLFFPIVHRPREEPRGSEIHNTPQNGISWP